MTGRPTSFSLLGMTKEPKIQVPTSDPQNIFKQGDHGIRFGRRLCDDIKVGAYYGPVDLLLEIPCRRCQAEAKR